MVASDIVTVKPLKLFDSTPNNSNINIQDHKAEDVPVDGNIRKSLPRYYLKNRHQLMVAINNLATVCFNRNECKRRQGSGDGVGDRAGGRRDKTGPS